MSQLTCLGPPGSAPYLTMGRAEERRNKLPLTMSAGGEGSCSQLSGGEEKINIHGMFTTWQVLSGLMTFLALDGN